jgi:AraC-like DNA-binding protein
LLSLPAMDVQKGLELSRERLAIEAVSLSEAAKIACLSPFHFHRLFTATYQCSPHAFATQVRIDHEEQLLLESELRFKLMRQWARQPVG